jgi:hypothetical protein
VSTVITPGDVGGYTVVSDDQLRCVRELVQEKLHELGYSHRFNRALGRAAYFTRGEDGEEPIFMDDLSVILLRAPDYECRGLRVTLRANCPRDIGNLVLATMKTILHMPEEKVETELKNDGVTYGLVSLVRNKFRY